MIDTLITAYTDFVALTKDNPFIASIIGLYVAGVTTWFLKDVPTRVSLFIKNELFTTLVIAERGETYGHMFDEKIQFMNFNAWVIKHSDNNLSRSLGINQHKGVWEIVPGIGLNFFIFQKRIFWYRKMEVQGSGQSNTGTKLQVNITTYGRNKKIFETMFNEFKNLHECEIDNDLYIRKIDGNGWDEIQTIPQKDLDVVFMNDHTRKELIETFEIFAEQLERCKRVQTSHRISILLEGPTGTGKTTIIKALANYLNKHIYMMDPADLLQSNLPRHLANWGHSGIIVVEDIDSLSSIKSRGKHINTDIVDKPRISKNGGKLLPFPRKKDKSNHPGQDLCEESCPEPIRPNNDQEIKIDFDINEFFGGISKVLNNLDGIVEYNGSIIIMTTNSVGLIDPAMLRPGRIDKIIHVGWLTKETIIENTINLFNLERTEENFLYLNKRIKVESLSGANLSNIYKFTNNLESYLDKINEAGNIK